jgi:hypothetical protein
MAGRLVGRTAAVVFGLVGACTWLGCNALAGIQLGTLAAEDSGAGAGGSDATTLSDANASGDSGSTKGGDAGVTDAGGDADASGGITYACAPSMSPFEVLSLQNDTDGGRQLDNSIQLGITQNQEARIIVLPTGQSGSGLSTQPLFMAYDVHWQPTMLDDSVVVMSGQGSHVASSEVTPNGITEIVTEGIYDQDAGGNVNLVEAYPLPAMTQSLNQAPTPYPLTTPEPSNNQSATALELGVEDQFVVTQPGTLLQSNRASRDGGPTTPTTFGTAPQQGGSNATLVHAGSNVFAVYGSDPTSDAGTVIYKLADDGVNTQLVTPGVLPSGTVIAGANPSTADPTKIAAYFATLETTPVVQFSLFSGLVDADTFDQTQTTSLTPGPSLTLHDVPANKGTTIFVGDQLVLLGLSPVQTDQGLNFVWVDTDGHVLAQAVGDNRLYNDRPGIQAAAIATANTLAGVLTSFFVAWVEEHTDTTGVYDVVYLDQVQCSKN